MKLNLAGRGACVALLMVVAAASQVSGTFADAAGFSGRAGVDCTACHSVAPIGHVPATAVLEGLPASWEPGATYPLTIRVEGGPQALPAPQPQGGFDLSVGAGRLALPPGTETQLRIVGPEGVEATYLPAGTLARQWRVDWVAPGLEAAPAAVPVWLAVLAANGNHVIASNTSDGGERFDATATLQASIPPSDAAVAAWRALPLRPALADAAPSGTPGTWRIEGAHADGNATRLAWSLDGQPWQVRDTAPTWRLDLAAGPGQHRLLLRSESPDRTAPDTLVVFGEPTLADKARSAGRDVPAAPLAPALAVTLALALAAARRSQP